MYSLQVLCRLGTFRDTWRLAKNVQNFLDKPTVRKDGDGPHSKIRWVKIAKPSRRA